MTETHFNIQLGDVDGDGNQDVTITTGNKKQAKITIYDVKQAAYDVVKIIVSVLVAMGIWQVV